MIDQPLRIMHFFGWVQERTINPVITEYDPKKGSVRTELGDLVLGKYNSASDNGTNGSTQPAGTVDTAGDGAESGGYNPFDHRRLSHPTTDMETLIHLMKGSLGTGILSMPAAFKNAGLFFGLFGTLFIGFVCTYCINSLVKSAQKLCTKMKVPSLGFAQIGEAAFLAGPPSIQKYASSARFLVDSVLVVELLGSCCIYVVFVAHNIKQVLDVNLGVDIDLQWYMLALLPLLICMNLIRSLKYLTPFSMLANALIGTGMGITFYYIFQDLPPLSARHNFSSLYEMPMFFGTAIFALEGIGVVMPLENNMKTPTHFIGCTGVLNSAMCLIVLIYSCVGFFGFLKYGEFTEPSITLNLPHTLLAQSVKLMIAMAIFLTYSLQFYTPMEIVWKANKHRFTKHPALAEYSIRTAFVIFTVVVALLVPSLGPFISLLGAVCLSFLGIMFPAIVEIVCYYGSDEGFGRGNWLLWRNLCVLLFGVVGLFTGVYTSIFEIMKDFKSSSH